MDIPLEIQRWNARNHPEWYPRNGYDIAVLNAANEGVEIAQSNLDGAGWGLFATRPYRIGKKITEMGGFLIPIEEVHDHNNPYMTQLGPKCGTSYGELIPQHFALNGETGYMEHQLGRFANAKINPNECNAVIETHYKDSSLVVYIVATKQIAENEEIYNDYGPLYPWENVLKDVSHDQILEIRRQLNIAFVEPIINDFPNIEMLKTLSNVSIENYNTVLEARQSFRAKYADQKYLGTRIDNCYVLEDNIYAAKIVAVANLQNGPIICFADDKRGYVLVADRNYAVNEKITEYGGIYLYLPDQNQARPSNYRIRLREKNYELDAEDQYYTRDKGRWINEPTYNPDERQLPSSADFIYFRQNESNVAYKYGDDCTIQIVAKRNIYMGEEFTIDYDNEYLRDYLPPFLWYNLFFKTRPKLRVDTFKSSKADRERYFKKMIDTYPLPLEQLTASIESEEGRKLWLDWLWKTQK